MDLLELVVEPAELVSWPPPSDCCVVCGKARDGEVLRQALSAAQSRNRELNAERNRLRAWFVVLAVTACVFGALLCVSGWKGLLFGGFCAAGAVKPVGARVRPPLPEESKRRDEVRWEGADAARLGRARASNPYAFDQEQSTRARRPVDARGRGYSVELDDAWDAGWLSAGTTANVRVSHRTWAKGSARHEGPAQQAGVVRVREGRGPAEPPGCPAGHHASRLQACPSCGEEFCDGPGHPRHACEVRHG